MTKLMCKIDAGFLSLFDKKRLKNQPMPDGVTACRDIAYIDDGHKHHLLDVYRPEKNDDVLPVIISVHGGSWCYADKEIYRNYCMDLCKRGFAVVNFSYRLAPEVPYYEQIKDTYAVFDWVKANAKEYKFDMENIFATGDSAGAQLCGMAVNITYDSKLQELFEVIPPFKFNAMCLNCGATELKDLSTSLGKLVFKYMIGPGFKKSPFYPVANYSDSVTKESCPVFFISGYVDFMRSMAMRVYNKVTDIGVVTKMNFREKGAHAKGHSPIHVYNVLQPYWDESIEVTNEMCDFFKSYIKNTCLLDEIV